MDPPPTCPLFIISSVLEAYVRRHRSHLSMHRLLVSAASVHDHDDENNGKPSRDNGEMDKSVASADVDPSTPAVRDEGIRGIEAESTRATPTTGSDSRHHHNPSLQPPSFFVKLRRWSSMTSKKDDEDRLIERLEKTFSVSRVVFDKFATLFHQLFREENREGEGGGDLETSTEGLTSSSSASDHGNISSGKASANTMVESAAESTVPALRRETRTYGKRPRAEEESSVSVAAKDIDASDDDNRATDSRSKHSLETRDGDDDSATATLPPEEDSAPCPPSLEEVRRYAWTLFVHVKSTFPAIAADLVNR